MNDYDFEMDRKTITILIYFYISFLQFQVIIIENKLNGKRLGKEEEEIGEIVTAARVRGKED